MVSDKNDVNKKTLLGYDLSPHQDAIVNYLVPSVCACLLYIFIIASDVAVVFCHYKNGDPIWASLTIFFMYLPILGSFIIIVTNLELWPEIEGCGCENIKWTIVKILEHLFFPVWSMWRFAERIFWSIIAVTSTDELSISEATSIVSAPRTIELYVFLQSYLHALPQILLQLYILMRHNSETNKETGDAQIMCLVFNLSKLSITTTYYQRFKAQKLTGKQYPWYKSYKVSRPPSVTLRRPDYLQSRSVIEPRTVSLNIEQKYNIEQANISQRRRSSDIYLEPSTSVSEYDSNRQTLLATNVEEIINTNEEVFREEPTRTSSATKYFTNSTLFRKFSFINIPRPTSLQRANAGEISEPDFNISRVIQVKGLKDDDLAGKLIAFLWWFCFLLARVLAISTFAYFFFKDTIWLLLSHYVIVMVCLLYDVKSDEVKRAKAVFFLFIGLIYIFCIIEFKIKFKKATFIYYGFFALVFLENFVMCLMWFLGQIESIENDFWFRYVFYIIVMCSLISFSSMVFYFSINKPPKVVVGSRTI